MSRRHEGRAVRKDHERRAHDRARQVLGRLSTSGQPVSESEVCRRANNLANCSCPLCKGLRYSSDGLSRADRRRLAGQEDV